MTSFHLTPQAPYRLDLTVWTLRRRADNLVDRWDGQTYRRTLTLHGEVIEVAVRQTGPPDAPRLAVDVSPAGLTEVNRASVTAALARLLGLRNDLTTFYQMAERDTVLRSLVRPFHGVKPPRFLSVYETLVTAVACQQVTLTLGIRLLNRLAQTYGPSSQVQPMRTYTLPVPEVLATLEPEALRELGFSRQKGNALVELSRAIVSGRLRPDELESMDDAEVVTRLRELKGVGRWTAEYVLLRGLGRLHVFPGDDVGARNNLQRWLSLGEPLDYAGVNRVVARWRPYAGLVYFHLLLESLMRSGYL